MTIQTVPYALQNASHSAALFREATSSLLIPTSCTMASAEMAVSQQASPNMSVQIAAGRAWIQGTSSSPPSGFAWTTQGMYFAVNDAPLTVTISASNPTNPRIDVVYVQVQDAFYSGATNTAVAGVVTGTPAVSPTVPATPSNAIALAQVAVAANATTIVNANITDVSPTVIRSGTLLGQVVVSSSAGLSSPGIGWETAAVQFTLPMPRIVRAHLEETILTASATAGSYIAQIGYQSGTGTGTPAGTSTLAYDWIAVTTTHLTIPNDGVFTLAAGAWSFYGGVARAGGGNSGDTRSNSFLQVFDAGAA